MSAKLSRKTLYEAVAWQAGYVAACAALTPLPPAAQPDTVRLPGDLDALTHWFWDNGIFDNWNECLKIAVRVIASTALETRP